MDGVILEGNTSIDEAAITGESIPVEKEPGSTVIAATINKAGFFKFRATKVGADTTLAQIIRLVEDASSSKAPIAKLADKISGVFVPVVIGIALAASIGWLLAGQTPEFAVCRSVSPCWSFPVPVRWVWPRPWPSWWAREKGRKTESSSNPARRWRRRTASTPSCLTKLVQ